MGKGNCCCYSKQLCCSILAAAQPSARQPCWCPATACPRCCGAALPALKPHPHPTAVCLPPLKPKQTFFSNALAAVGGTTAGPGLSVVNVYLNYEKKFAFVEFRTVEEASNAMALDGIMFEGGPVSNGRGLGNQAVWR